MRVRRSGAAAHDVAMDPIALLQMLGSIAPIRALQDAGVSEHALRAAKARGQIRTVRRGWVALPGADPALVAVARAGVVLSCASLAARKGLWVRGKTGLHVAAPPRSGHVHAGSAVVHWNTPLLPRDPNSCEDRLENALVIASMCLAPEDALILWESALNQGMVSKAELLRMGLPRRVRRLLERAQPFSDSGLESIVVYRLRWLNVPMLQQTWILGHRVDLLIGARLVVQIDGRHHVGEQRAADIAHDALLTLNGYHVIRVGYQQIMDEWPHVQATIMAAIAQGLHLVS